MSEYDEDEILCAVTGIAPTETELDNAEDGIPEGWIRLTAERKFVNPKWEAIQMVKQGLMQQTLATIPEKDRENQLINVAIQVEAQFALLEDKTDQYFTITEEIVIAPPETNEYVKKAIGDTLSLIGFAEIFQTDEEDEEGDEAEPVAQKVKETTKA